MAFLNQISFTDLHFSREYLRAAVLVCLLSVWVLVGLFYYLNLYTRRRYFTIWTAAWLFYALWITLSFGIRGEQAPAWLIMLQQWCVGVSAVFLFWGSEVFIGQRVRQRLIGLFLLFLLVWSYIGAYHLDNTLQLQVPLFTLIAAASFLTAYGFLRYRRQRGYIGATLLTLGFLLWACYMASYPFLENSEDLVSVALFISAVIQLLVAVSMIILVLEESRSTHQAAVQEIQLRSLERDELRTKVVSSEERYRRLFDHAGEAIVIVRAADFRILELNHAAERLLGVSRSEAEQHSFATFCQLKNPIPDTAPGAELFQAVSHERPMNLIRKDGKAVRVEVDGSETDFADQPSFQLYVRELTERARLEQQLRQAEKLSALGQMISGVAHELNNPLAVVKGYLELILAHHELPSQTRSDLEKVARESERAAKLVRNFLSFAREQPSHRELVDFNEIIQRIGELRKLDFNVAGVEFRSNLDPTLPQTAADRDQMQQVLVNLVTNSLQALAEMPGKGRIEVHTRRKDDLIQISVEDNGPGVPDALAGKIFEPFFTTKEVGTGTGLGLSIAHSIMTEHKGRILYQRSPMGGAAFVLELPIVSATNTESVAPEIVEPLKPQSAPVTGRILVLDDEKGLADMLGEILKLLGHQPTVCNSGAQALGIIERENFDVVISDFRMPGLNGRQFYELATLKRPELAKRIIFLTGDVVNEETQGFLRSTGNPHLGKPFNLSSVKDAVLEVLNRNGVSA